MVAHGPTFAATVGRRNHVEVMHFCPDLEGGFSQKVATFWTVPCKAGQIFLTHTFSNFFGCGSSGQHFFSGGTWLDCMYLLYTHPPVHYSRQLKSVAFYSYPYAGQHRWQKFSGQGVGLLENENSSKSNGSNSFICTQHPDSG